MKSIRRLLLLLLVSCTSSIYARTDSTGLKIFSNNKVFIVHQVEKSQGLYAIARRYKVDLKDIQLYNPEVVSSGIKVDQYIFIPTKLSPAQAEALIKKADNSKTADENGTSQPTSKGDNVVYYTVKVSETLFSISRLPQCEFTIDEIKRWNNLKTNSVSENQKLIIAFRKEVKIKPDPVPVQDVQEVIEGNPSKGSSEDNNDQAPKDTAKVEWSDKSDEGLASWIKDNPENEKKSYVLCSKVKPGKIIRIENLANNKATYAQVIGPLVGNEIKDVIIVLPEHVAQKLDVKDATFRVELSYSDDE